MKPDSMGFADWVRSHALSLDTLDPHAGLDDLEPVREFIGDARVVAIGEAAHHVREFSLVRHRLLRFLAERCGFTVLAVEAPTVGADAIDAWLHGGAGTVAEIASRAGMVGLLESREVHDLLAWIRAHNRTASRPLRWIGTVPGGGSPLPELEAAAVHLRSADPDALPLLEQAAERARKYHDSEIFTTLSRYAALEPADQDALTATLSRLRFRLETMAAGQRGTHREQEHAAALRHLGFAWRLDHFHRDVAGRGLPVGSAALDECMAEEVLQLLEDEPETRVVLALHNVHIRKVPQTGLAGLFPAGYHLAQALGDDYRAIAVTGGHGRTARVRPAPERFPGFEVSDVPLPSLTERAIENAFESQTALTIAILSAARRDINDAESFQQTRMEDDFMDVPVFDAFDAIAHTPLISCTDYVATHSSRRAGAEAPPQNQPTLEEFR